MLENIEEERKEEILKIEEKIRDSREKSNTSGSKISTSQIQTCFQKGVERKRFATIPSAFKETLIISKGYNYTWSE